MTLSCDLDLEPACCIEFCTSTETNVSPKLYENHSRGKGVSYDFASESEITPCNKIDKPLVVYRFTGNVMTFITTLRT